MCGKPKNLKEGSVGGRIRGQCAFVSRGEKGIGRKSVAGKREEQGRETIVRRRVYNEVREGLKNREKRE